MEIKSFETLAEADPRRIEIVTGRKFPFGDHIKDSLLSLPPKVDIKVEEIECQSRGKSKLVVTLTRTSEPFKSMKRHYADMVCFVEFHFSIFFRFDDAASINCSLKVRTHYDRLLVQKKIT